MISIGKNYQLLQFRAEPAHVQEITQRFSSDGQLEPTLWQGVQDPAEHLYLARDREEGELFPSKTISQLTGRVFSLRLDTWIGASWISTAAVANFVIRTIDPDSTPSLLPQIRGQAEVILKTSACVAFTLFQVDGSPAELLGITAWPDLESFDEYAGWAKTHPWADVIGPKTIGVPLRMLTRQVV